MSTNQDKRAHSVKVPRLYKVASGVLRDFQNGAGSVRNLVHSDSVMKKHPNFKAIFSLVTSCVDHLPDLQSAFQRLDILNKEKPLQENLAFILATELIWGKGELPGESKPIQTVRKYGDQLKKQLLQGGANLSKNSAASTGPKRPRYVRINVLLAGKKEVLQRFTEDGYEQIYFDEHLSYEDFIGKVTNLESHQFIADFHVDNLLVFPEKSEFHQHPLYLEGKIILQDKASCLPVQALACPPGSTVLDACAAPGMKTSQLAASVSSRFFHRGHVIAVERDAARCETLRTMLTKSGADNFVQVINGDFLKIDPSEYENVEYILLDPTCSGSGMKDRRAGSTDVSEARLTKLFSLQCKMLRHALSFPNVKRVSYSTCSVEKKENEEVIADVMSNPVIYEKWEVAEALPMWERRGKSQKKFKFAKKLIRSDPEKDLCIGFFVAILQRKAQD